MRITRHAMWLEMARVASRRSTCFRLAVGAVLVQDERRVIAIGYNGASSGLPHCGGGTCQYFSTAGCTVQHAESNALRIAGHLPSGQLHQLYSTHSPCSMCADLIIMHKIRDVYYEAPYRDPAPIMKMLGAGVGVFRLLPSGFVIDDMTGDMVQP